MHILKQMVTFLSEDIREVLKYVNFEKVYELRLRADRPLCVNYAGKYQMLGRRGVTDKIENCYIVTKEEIEEALFRAGEYSVYSVEEQIRSGFLTTSQGVRIGIAGRYVFDRGQPLTIRDVGSLCIRIPHQVKGAGEEIYNRCMRGKSLQSVLLLSLPGRGKTTALRELCRLLSKIERKNILVCDERGELDFGELGPTCDVLSYADKATAFEVGIRTLRPDVIVTDELAETDILAVKRAISSGVSVLASAHIKDAREGKLRYAELFDRYVLFEKEEVGKVEKIFDANWREIS